MFQVALRLVGDHDGWPWWVDHDRRHGRGCGDRGKWYASYTAWYCRYIPLPCGLHIGPILLTWHINDLKGTMMVYDNLICLYTTQTMCAANDVCAYTA